VGEIHRFGRRRSRASLCHLGVSLKREEDGVVRGGRLTLRRRGEILAYLPSTRKRIDESLKRAKESEGREGAHWRSPKKREKIILPAFYLFYPDRKRRYGREGK